jgi:hypothetical protein
VASEIVGEALLPFPLVALFRETHLSDRQRGERMKRSFVGGLALLLLGSAPVWAVSVNVGEHWLIPNTPDQKVPVLVSGGDDTAGLNFFATIGGGGAANGGVDGPAFEESAVWAPAMKLGTIWDDSGWDPDNFTLTDVYEHPFGSQFAAGSLFIYYDYPPGDPLPPGTVTAVPADGVLINLMVDTTGWSAGTWDLAMMDAQPFGDDPTELLDAGGWPLEGVAVASGSITIATRGDSDLDGDIDFGDFNSLANNYTGSLAPGTGGKVWDQGDFDFDGDVDFADFNDIADNYTGPVGGGKAVPEPSTVVSLWTVAAVLAVCLRRRPNPSGQTIGGADTI